MSFISGYEYADKIKPKIFGTKRHPAIVRYFEKTPKNIVCPHFYELNWAYGCRFACSYCYLQGTFRGNTQPYYLPLKEVLETFDKVFNHPYMVKPAVFNSGELTDSMVFPSIIEKICDKFEEQNTHKILLLTKSNIVDFLVKKPRKQTIVSFSMNAKTVSEKWEKKTAPVYKRIEAAKKVYDVGYEVRIRIDPIFPIPNWKKEYEELIHEILTNLKPTRITLGTPRGLLKTMLYSKDLSWWKFAFEENPSEDTGWGKKLASGIRKEIYLFLIEKLREKGFNGDIALCKETPEMWKGLGMNPGSYPDWKYCKCNCVW